LTDADKVGCPLRLHENGRSSTAVYGFWRFDRNEV